MALSDIYRAYEALMPVGDPMHPQAESLGGSLLLLSSLNERGTALATAANIAGAATLALEGDATRARAAVRTGVCDFMVTNLDEALRILKNEVRKKKPVSVALVAEPGAVLRECAERGVRPELVASSELAILGGQAVVEVPSTHPLEVRWSAPPGNSLALTKVDTLATAVLDGHAGPRRRWLAAAPRYVGRPMLTERYVRLEADEADQLRALLLAGVADGSVLKTVTMKWS